MINYKISFCTVCMNRLHHLKETLPVNILDNRDYNNAEFILLDYNSTDGIEDFVETEMKEYLDSGKLIYYKTPAPQYFNRSHSRNLAFKLSSGDLICNLDADNFTGSGFASYLNTEFNKNGSLFLTAIGAENATQDVFGRICVKRKNFFELTGYDERMTWYGFEDHDLVSRLELKGIKRSYIARNYLTAIQHEQKERLSKEQISSELTGLYVSYLTPSSTDFLFLFKDGVYRRGILIDNHAFSYKRPVTALEKFQLNYEYSIYNNAWIKGRWHQAGQKITIQKDDRPPEYLIYDREKNRFELQDQGFYLLTEPRLVEDAVMFFSQVSNRIIMSENKVRNRVEVNRTGFGRDIVYKNFNYHQPVNIQ